MNWFDKIPQNDGEARECLIGMYGKQMAVPAFGIYSTYRSMYPTETVTDAWKRTMEQMLEILSKKIEAQP